MNTRLCSQIWNSGQRRRKRRRRRHLSKKEGNLKLELEYLLCHEVQKKEAEEGK